MWTKQEQKEHRAKLYKALRDGSYKQSMGSLRFGKSYCCLGVASDLCATGDWDNSQGVWYFTDSEGATNHTVLTHSVKDYYGFPLVVGFELHQIDPGIDYNGEHLASLNDSGFGFDRIADLMEYYFYDEDHAPEGGEISVALVH